ncbi:MAG TPA: hypothetical protein PLB31_01645 [Fimbriimonadaceae bacterium]|nr:hypothetical protein [Fimbriimonadaceae bacterium]HRI73157.1 hypothetical protein [Fimbriimonadaceae bacterium]
MDESGCSVNEILERLDAVAPGVPLLALGQTVFWDEPMKAGLALAAAASSPSRPFIAGVHDTDYFAKAPRGIGVRGYTALPHNDTTTQNLWSAAAEFSTLFGGETVVTRDRLTQHGVSLGRLGHGRPGLMDELTEAWGWRGLAAAPDDDRIAAETPLHAVLGPLFDTLEWAVQSTLDCLTGPAQEAARRQADHLLSLVCEGTDEGAGDTLADYYERIVPGLYSFAAGEKVPLQTTRTTELLAFNPRTCDRERFAILDLFLNPETRAAARHAYDRAVQGTEMYTLDRFGAGAVPFDVVIPGRGRGTLRVGTRGLLIMTPDILAVSYKRAPTNRQELAALLEERFGPGVTLVGKAVTLISLLAREFVFVFHEGASGYVSRSRTFHRYLAEAGHPQPVHPLVRVGYSTWEALDEVNAWFRLPEPLRRPFGADELSGVGFSARMGQVRERAYVLLDELKAIRSPRELVRYLERTQTKAWSCPAQRYDQVQSILGEMAKSVAERRAAKRQLVDQAHALAQETQAAARALGEHWRDAIFEKDPTPDDWARREELVAELKAKQAQVDATWSAWRQQQAELDAFTELPEIVEAKRTRDALVFEAELTRVRLIREAILATDGLARASHRPSAWWFPLVSPQGQWFRAVHRRARYRFEPLQ